jgi:hypothetical protein
VAGSRRVCFERRLTRILLLTWYCLLRRRRRIGRSSDNPMHYVPPQARAQERRPDVISVIEMPRFYSTLAVAPRFPRPLGAPRRAHFADALAAQLLILSSYQKLSGSQGNRHFRTVERSVGNPSSKTKSSNNHRSAHLRTQHRGPMSVHNPHSNQSTVSYFLPRQPIAINGFCRVTKYRPCRVCGKTDWCGYTTDGQTSICMRISNGSKGTSRNGGYIYHHGGLHLAASLRFNRKPARPQVDIAPIEIRNAVYQELIRTSPALKYYSQLIDGPDGLLSRGLREADTQDYGALPRTQKERATLARTLNKFVTVRFPEHAPRNSRAGVTGVPGFWQDESAIVQLWKPRDYNMPLLVIPYRDDQGRIQACQLRLHRNDISPGEKKYRWLACPFETRGTSSGTPIHFTFRRETLTPGQTVIITEGALKAQTLVSLRPKACVIATSGVSCSHAEIIAAARAYNALIAFDADYKMNPAVARQLARLIAAREQDTAVHRLPTSTRILCWQRYKGIDDAVLANMPLETMTILQWISTLDGRLLQEVLRVWEQMGFTPNPVPSKTDRTLAE